MKKTTKRPVPSAFKDFDTLANYAFITCLLEGLVNPEDETGFRFELATAPQSLADDLLSYGRNINPAKYADFEQLACAMYQL